MFLWGLSTNCSILSIYAERIYDNGFGLSGHEVIVTNSINTGYNETSLKPYKLQFSYINLNQMGIQYSDLITSFLHLRSSGTFYSQNAV